MVLLPLLLLPRAGPHMARCRRRNWYERKHVNARIVHMQRAARWGGRSASIINRGVGHAEED